MRKRQSSASTKSILLWLLRHCGVALCAFVALGLLVSLALNLSFLNPVAQTMKGFSLTDIYYNVLQEYGEADTSRVVTIVDITDVPDRLQLAEVLAEVESMKPKVVGVDVIFEGFKPDTVGDMRLVEVAQENPNIVWSYHMLDWGNDSVGYTNEVHSFFANMVPVNEGFTNCERDLYGGMKRQANLVRLCNGERRSALVYDVANHFADGKLAVRDEDDLNINFQPTVFKVIPYDSVSFCPDLIEGRVVLYGADREITDMHYTPLGKLAGIELLAYSVQTLLEQTEVRHLSKWMTALFSFLIVLITQILRSSYLKWTRARRSAWLRFFLGSVFMVGILLFLWSTVLMGGAFLLFCKTGISFDLGWALAAIPFLRGAKEFFEFIMLKVTGNNIII